MEKDSSAPAPQPAGTIIRLLTGDKRESARTILITGPWGCGKTYMWKEIVAKAINRPSIYVSAFGADSPAALKSRLLTHFAFNLAGRADKDSDSGFRRGLRTLADPKSRFGRVVSGLVNSVGSSLLGRADIDPIEFVDLLAENTVICIDDLERTSTSFSPVDLLAITNIISEHKKLDVVLICNEDRLTQPDTHTAAQYLLYKEKTITHVFTVKADPASVFDRLCRSAVGSSGALARVTSASDTIKQVFALSKTENLRLVASICRTLELMYDAGVRPLTEPEVRFLSAAVINEALNPPQTADFYDFNGIALRMVTTLSRSRNEPDPVDIARQSFLDRYFSDIDYEYYPAVLAVIRTGVPDPVAFVVIPEKEPTEFEKCLSLASRGNWKYFTDAQLRELRSAFVAFLAADAIASASDIILCLGLARHWDTILGEDTASAVTGTVHASLRRIASSTEQTLGREWAMAISPLVDLIATERDIFLEASQRAERARAEAQVRQTLATGSLEDLHGLLGGSSLSPIQIVFDVVGIENALTLRTTDPKRFLLITETLLTQCDTFSHIWKEAKASKAALIDRLIALRDDGNEEAMSRWRITSLLKGHTGNT